MGITFRRLRDHDLPLLHAWLNDPEVVRFFIVRAHYRSPLNYSDQHLDDAKSALTRLYTALRGEAAEVGEVDWHDPRARRFRAEPGRCARCGRARRGRS